MINSVTGTNTDLYRSYTPTSQTPSGQSSAGETATSSDNATNVTFSDAAKQALQVRNFGLVADDARENMDKLLDEVDKTSPLKDGKLDVDLSGFDRRELYAISINEGQDFPDDQQKAATLELERRFDQVVSTASAVARVTGDYAELYQTALNYMEQMGPEERATIEWGEQKAAIDDALIQLSTNPGALPTGIANDPVAARLDKDATDSRRDFGDVASDARVALNKQIEAAKAAGRNLNFSTNYQSGNSVDFSNFDTRSLSAIAQNEGGQFERSEMHAARMEVHSRSGRAILAAFRNAQEVGGPATFAKNIITQYSSMSGEERETAGWTPEFYETVVQNYETSSRIISMLSSAIGQNNSGFGGF